MLRGRPEVPARGQHHGPARRRRTHVSSPTTVHDGRGRHPARRRGEPAQPSAGHGRPRRPAPPRAAAAAAPAPRGRGRGTRTAPSCVHRVRAGETATALAVRYHAWTAELVALNRLGRGAHVYVGQRLRIPVVLSAVRKARGHGTGPEDGPDRPETAATARRAGRNADMSRAQVRDLVVRTARAHGVPSRLALAVAWQESGWQQRRVSSAGAIGVMQVLPSTGRWMRLVRRPPAAASARPTTTCSPA